ncbi:MAG: type 2 isopentenyl-diphosphate Delta-isomerase [Bacteriovoracaceae bacterium]|nr:type 2 isopentenyl-diphosphate Delta-isomerase [Bacteriovoracaceae bacterium]
MTHDRKQDHITLALRAKTWAQDTRFNYEPMLSVHPKTEQVMEIQFLGKKMNYPWWFSSMTGGTASARKINENMARVCGEFGLGMALGSLRPLLNSTERFEDFSVRKFMPNAPLFGNLGVAQVEELIRNKETNKIDELIDKLNLDGLVVHVNPLQEWLQAEGDRYDRPPLNTMEELLSKANYPIIVKEVGQGMGPASLKKLMELPLAAIELAAFGGTNFSAIEGERTQENFSHPLVHVGHTALEMIKIINANLESPSVQCRSFILSGGVKNTLDGYYLMQSCRARSVFAMASEVLKRAHESYEDLYEFVQAELQTLTMAQQFLQVRD